MTECTPHIASAAIRGSYKGDSWSTWTESTVESITDEEALNAIITVSEQEGILPALETAHAFAYLEKLMPATKKDEIVIVNVSGRGDKDLNTIIDKIGDEI